MKKIRSFFIILVSALILVSCSEEYLNTEPTNAVAADAIFSSTQGVNVALNVIYRWFYWYHGTGHDDFGYKALDLKNDLMGADMKVFSYGYGWFIRDYNYVERGNPADETTTYIAWKLNYEVIYNANMIIANIENAAGPLEEKQFYSAQAYALRAYAYMSLGNWYGPAYTGNESVPCVPIKVTPDEEHKPIATVGEVWTQAKNDIAEAIRLFGLAGVDREPKSQINMDVAYGIQARIALAMEEWDLAITAAQAAIGTENAKYPLMSVAEYQGGFKELVNNEWMWGMEINAEQATVYASYFSHLDPVQVSYASLGLQKQLPQPLYDQLSDTDVRKSVFVSPDNAVDSIWFDYTGVRLVPTYVCIKFLAGGTWECDYPFMRAAEMYLIEAEAAAELGQDPAAQAALNKVLDARDPGTTTSNTGQALKDEIYLNRRVEFFGEGISGLADIKRKKIALDRQGHDPALCLVTNLPAEDYQFNLRIPQWEIDANDNISEADQRD